jgi:hemin uptake protein HemP
MLKNSRVEEFKTESKKAPGSAEHLALGAPSRIFESAELFGSEQEIGIVHQGAMYRLRVTRGGKLILNK